MSIFHYSALRPDGETVSGDREAESKHALIETLRGEGLVTLQADESLGVASGTGVHSSMLSMKISMPFSSHVPTNEKILFARNLAAMIVAGLPLSRALGVLQKQTRNAGMRDTIDAISDDIRQGHALHEALRRHPKVFSNMFIAMTRAGEESGTLADSLQTVATQTERSYLLTKKVRGAMIYPSIVITVMLGIGILMLIYVVPTLSETFAALGSDLPVPTKIILATSGFIIGNSVAVAAGTIALVLLLIAALRTPPGRRAFDRALLAFPIVGPIIAKVNAARTARTLSSLLTAGVSALSALEITGDVVQNTRFRPIIARARDYVEKGKPMSAAFVEAENIYPVMFAEMAAVGEETGDMAGMLTRVSDFYENEVEQQTKDLSTVIEPLLMVVIGGAVGFFAMAMIMPIYALSNSM